MQVNKNKCITYECLQADNVNPWYSGRIRCGNTDIKKEPPAPEDSL